MDGQFWLRFFFAACLAALSLFLLPQEARGFVIIVAAAAIVALRAWRTRDCAFARSRGRREER